ncbi:MAG: hypothetical protein ACXWUG_13195 [Polyangiales bacterium]
MNGVYAIADKGTRSFWAAWWTVLPSRARFVPPDARGEAVDVHAAKQAAFEAFAKARGVTGWREVDATYATAADRWARGIDPVFPGDKKRAVPKLDASLDLPDDVREILDLRGPATLESAREAYRRRALELHPDRGGTHEQMLALNRAWEVVKKQS